MRLFLILLTISLASCSDSLEDRVSKLPYKSENSGIRISADSQITTEKIAQIENGIRITEENARCLGYYKEFGLSNYKVSVVSPSTTFNGVNWIEYNGQMVAGVYSVDLDMLILVDQPDLTTIVSYEAEHRVLFFNDKNKYRLWNHTTNDSGHPLFKPCK